MSPCSHPNTPNALRDRYLLYGYPKETKTQTVDGKEEGEGSLEYDYGGESKALRSELTRQLVLPNA